MSTVTHLRSKYNPINGRNLVPKHQLPPFNKCRVNQLPTKSDFDNICCIKTLIHSNGNATTVLLQNLQTSGYSIAKIYNCFDIDSKKQKEKLNRCWKEYQIIKHSALIEYFGIYYDAKTVSIIIHQQCYEQTLHQHISQTMSNTDHNMTELKCKYIAKNILLSLWKLHNQHYVHCDIKPDNIMQRKLDHLYQTEFIKDGWLLIDFGEIKKNKSKGTYVGTMGWSAPEIEYNAKKNIYTYSSDIFAFGLIILYILFGEQPLQIPDHQRIKYQINIGDDQKEILKKRVLRKQILTNWYYGFVRNSQQKMKDYLYCLYHENKISHDLYQLLNDGILIYDAKKRYDVKKIYHSKWFENSP